MELVKIMGQKETINWIAIIGIIQESMELLTITNQVTEPFIIPKTQRKL